MSPPLRHVLLVDDNEDDNYFHRRSITKSGRDVAISVCRDGGEALEYLDQDPSEGIPDLIFLDINMPKMNGWEFIDAFARRPGSQRDAVVVVMLSTSPNPADRERADRTDVVREFIDKPLRTETFTRIADTYFGGDDDG